MPDRGRWGRQQLKRVVDGIRGEVAFHASLRDFTSFRIGGLADVLVIPDDLQDVTRLMRQASAEGVPVFVLGGTNVLIQDGGIRGVVMNLGRLNAIRDEEDGAVYAEGGVGMPALLRHAISRSLGGLEWAAGIPGTVGGCVVMNAGTRLGEMSQAIKAVRMVTPSGEIRDLPASAIPFRYRRARLPRGIVVGVWLRLASMPRELIATAVREYLRYRKATQPLAFPNAGCVFKNPGPQAAGQLIEAVGLKGARVGDAQVSEKHGNFVVNLGQARAAQVLQLVRHVRRTIAQQTGIRLELELKIVGEPEDRRNLCH